MPFPRSNLDLVTTLPKNFAFKTPEPEDIDEEGFGFFRDVWPIVGGSLDYARDLVAHERQIADMVSSIAKDSADFDQIAHDVEDFDPDDEDEYFSALAPIDSGRLRAILPYANPLDGLDLGVAGLATALAAIGFFPAASCRGHTTVGAWSERPVVHFAADRRRAEWLEPHVESAGCGLGDGTGNGAGLLIVEAPSILETMILSVRILRSADSFTNQR